MIMKPACTTTVAAAVILLLGAALAGAQGMHGVREQNNERVRSGYGDHYTGGDRTVAAAALEPVGAADDNGWGRVVVMDLAGEETMDRVAVVHLFDLSGQSEYEVWLNKGQDDEVLLGSLATDDNGDAWLRLSTIGNSAPTPPDNMPFADALIDAVVEDSSGAVTLSGTFTTMIQGGSGNPTLTYMERITLDPVPDYADHGVARVARDLDGEERFQTAACGLVPNASYYVFVNGNTPAGMVVADPIGHACLVLATDSETNPLPSDLQPIESIGEVKWTTTDAEQVTVLIGSFSGENMVGGGSGPHGGGGGGGDGGPGDGDCDGGNGNGDGDGDCDGGGGGNGGTGGGGRP